MPFDPALDELAGQQSMTHQPEQPNPAAPYLAGARAIGRAPLDALQSFNDRIGFAMSTPPGMTPSDLEQQARIAASLGLDVMGGGMGLGTKFAEKNALGMMGGGRGFSELAARSGDASILDLDFAKQMEAQGIPRSQILALAQWYKEHPSGIWNKEIFDNPATLNEAEIPSHHGYWTHDTTVGAFLNHPDLYNVYPHLRDIPITFANSPMALRENLSARYYHPGQTYPEGGIILYNPHIRQAQDVKKSLLHELQHAVDIYEGRKLVPQPDNMPDNVYFKLIEEMRARNTEWRSNYPEEILTNPGMEPWKTMEKMKQPFREHQAILPPP